MRVGLIVLAFLMPGSAEAGELKPWQNKALEAVRSEATVIDAYWRSTEANILYVSRKSDGTRQDGFAQYLCTLFGGTGAPQGELKTVQIYDPANYALAKTASGRNMGLAACR